MLVAEILSIRQSTLQKKKCIFVLPFVSIVTEKTKHFRNLLEGTDVAVESFHGGARPVDTWNIAICTIEKVFVFPSRLHTPRRITDSRQIR